MILNSKKNYNIHIWYADLALCIFSTAHHMLFILHMLEKNFVQSAIVIRLLVDSKKMSSTALAMTRTDRRSPGITQHT